MNIVNEIERMKKELDNLNKQMEKLKIHDCSLCILKLSNMEIFLNKTLEYNYRRKNR